MEIKKIAIIGGESTGKSELATSLAHYFQTIWVPEYAREYLTKLNRTYELNDLTHIAKGQMESERQLLMKAKRLIFLDTTLDVIRVWSEFKYNTCNRLILNHIAQDSIDVYLLAYPDIPWEPDPLREHPDEHTREQLYRHYLDIALASDKPFFICKGDKMTRLNGAVNFLNSICKLE